MSFYLELHQQLMQSKKRIAHRKRATTPNGSDGRNGGTGASWPSAAPASAAPSVKPAWRRARAFSTINYRVPGLVAPIRQPSSMTCWATVTTIMMSWREQVSMSIETAMSKIGQTYVDAFRANRGLSASEKGPFLAAAGLQAEPPMSYSIEGWQQLLRTYGPLWVTGDESQTDGEFAIHARVMVGISSDGTPNGTQLQIVDPATGTEYAEDLNTFLRKYEREAADSNTRVLRIQVVHWPPNAAVAAQSLRAERALGYGNGYHRSYGNAYADDRRTRAFEDAAPAPASSPPPVLLAWGAKVSPEFRERVRRMASDLGCDPDHLMAAMAFETGATFSPSIRNAAGSGATGLIQFMPSTAKDLGTTTEALAQLSAVEQLDYVQRYMSRYRGRLSSVEDVYMAILMPSAIGQPNDHVLFDGQSQAGDERRRRWHRRAYEQNRGLDRDNDGKVTKAEAASVVTRMLARGREPANMG